MNIFFVCAYFCLEKLQECKRSINGSSLDNLLEKKGLSVTRNHRNKRKASNPQQLRALTAFVGAEDEDDEVKFSRTFFAFQAFTAKIVFLKRGETKFHKVPNNSTKNNLLIFPIFLVLYFWKWKIKNLIVLNSRSPIQIFRLGWCKYFGIFCWKTSSYYQNYSFLLNLDSSILVQKIMDFDHKAVIYLFVRQWDIYRDLPHYLESRIS